MKVESKSVRKYEPIIITLETAREYFSVLAALGLSSDSREVERLQSLGISVGVVYESDALYLHGTLCQYFDKVKETL